MQQAYEAENSAGVEEKQATTDKNARRLTLGLIAAIVVTLICWASAFAAIRAALHGYSAVHLALLRYLVASIALAGYALVTRMPLPHWRDIPLLLCTGILGIACYNVGINIGEITVPAGLASFLVNTVPIFTTLSALLFLKESPRLLGWIGIGISTLGIAIIAIGTDGGLHFSPGTLFIILASLAESLYFVWQKPYLKRYTAVQCTTYAIWGGSLAMLIFLPGFVDNLRTAATSETLEAVYLGIFPGAIAYVCWAYILSRIPAARATSFLYLVPPMALTIGWFWLGEWPAWLALFGGLIVITGVMLVNLPQTRRST